MRKIEYLVILGAILMVGGCEGLGTLGSLSESGSWVSSGGRNPKSSRNQHYTFKVTADGPVDITLESSVSDIIYILDNTGATSTYSGADILQYQLTAGNYTVVAATYTPGESGDFQLSLSGSIENLASVPTTVLSETGTWISSGSTIVKSYRNPHYTFDVTEDSYVDIILQATDSDVYEQLFLSDLTNGQVYNGAEVINMELRAGSYTITAGTYYGGVGENKTDGQDFNIRIFGKIANLALVPSEILSMDGVWTSSASTIYDSFRNPHYTFDVDEDSYIDILMYAADASVNERLFLIDPSNGDVFNGTTHIGRELKMGSYTAVAGTYYWNVGSNKTDGENLTIKVFGKVSNLAEVPANRIIQQGNWTSSGGPTADSPGNFVYSFDVSEDSYVDILLDAASIGVTGRIIVDSGAPQNSVGNNRVGIKLLAGSHTVEAATTVAGQSSDFTLTLYGKVGNLVAQ